jgi:hypothetical protein
MTIMHDFAQKKGDHTKLKHLLDQDEARFVQPIKTLILDA